MTTWTSPRTAMMTRLSRRTLLAAAMLAGAASSAQAQTLFDVVRDERGEFVHNSFGNCVRTRWISAADACGPQPVKTVQTQRRTYIAKDERTVYFGFDKADLTPEARQKLDHLSQTLRSDDYVQQARIVGYTDRIGKTDYNEKLSMRRAETVRKHLQQNGVVTAQKTEVRWLGETVPVTSCPDNLPRPKLIECLQRDRRVEVEVDYLPVAPAQPYPGQTLQPMQAPVQAPAEAAQQPRLPQNMPFQPQQR
jgi:outer membrane protein OmpA-like peptidoglycan-associated protein